MAAFGGGNSVHLGSNGGSKFYRAKPHMPWNVTNPSCFVLVKGKGTD